MKKLIQVLSLTTGLPYSGRSITLVRVFPNDGIEVGLTELGTSGTYKAAVILPGVYHIWDRTSGTPGVDLDQEVDVVASKICELTLPNAGSGKLDKGSGIGGRVWNPLSISDVSTLSTTLAGKEPGISSADATYVYHGDKVFRSLLKAEFSAAIPIKAIQANVDNSDISMTAQVRIVQIIKGIFFVRIMIPGISALNTTATSASYQIDFTPYMSNETVSNFVVSNGYMFTNEIFGTIKGDGVAYPNPVNKPTHFAMYNSGVNMITIYNMQGYRWKDVQGFNQSTYCYIAGVVSNNEYVDTYR